MNSYFVHVIAETGIPGAQLGAILPVEHFEHLGRMAQGPASSYTVLIEGREQKLLPHDVEIIDAAAAKKLRTTRKRDADRAAASWRGSPKPSRPKLAPVTKAGALKVYEVVRWQVGKTASRFHVRLKGRVAALCGDPVITNGDRFIARAPADGSPSNPLVVIDDLMNTRAGCRNCLDVLARQG